MSKPYTEDELREKFLQLGPCIGPYDSPHRCSAMHCDHCGLCDVSEDFLQLITSYTQAKEQEAYNRGYNTGWQKAKRSHDVRRLSVAAEQLEALAKTMRESAGLAAQKGGGDQS